MGKAKNASIKTKVLWLTFASVFILCAILMSVMVFSIFDVDANSKEIASENLLKEVKNSIQNNTQAIVGNSVAQYNAERDTLPEDVLIAKILDNIRNTKYSDSGYYFVYTYDGIRLVSPENKAQEGENLWDLTDENGNKPVQEFVKQAKAGGGFITYMWLDPQSNAVEEKISYTAPLKLGDTEVLVGTGTYLPMLEETGAQMAASLESTITTLLWITIPAILLLTLIVLFVMYTYFSRRIIKPITMITKSAEALASGDTDVHLDIRSKDETGQLASAFNQIAGSLKALTADTNMLSEAAMQGEFDVRADASGHRGEYKRIVAGMNQTLDTVVDKVFWYESILDSMPILISVVDMDMRWTFVNKAVEDALGIKRKDLIGKKCENWDTSLCRTENCAIARFKKGLLRTEFEHKGVNLQANSAYLQNMEGENTGYIEAIFDITPQVRSARYSDEEVRKLARNLKLLSEGNLALEFEVAQPDEYTEQERQKFEAINASLKNAVDSIGAYIGEISRILNEMAQGNMNEKVDMEFAGDFTVIKDAINTILESLNAVLCSINRAADEVAAGTRQVSDGSQGLSHGAAEQASSVEQLTASIAQIASQTKQNAQNATQASELAIAAEEYAANGNERMRDMLGSMDNIKTSSHNISKIIKVIDSIAFQTNILALNAAVEAARAGIHGKGFAVVAEEVRDLAGRSAQAAKETTEMIERSIHDVEEGTVIAHETAKALTMIVDEVDKAGALVGDIAVASNEQAAAIDQINQGIELISQVVQNNSATAEQSAATTEEVYAQAAKLKSMVGKFRLAAGDTQQGEIIDLSARVQRPAANNDSGRIRRDKY